MSKTFWPNIGVEYDLNRLRLLASTVRKNKGEFSTEQTEAFLLLYKEELQDLLDKTVRGFLQEKLG